MLLMATSVCELDVYNVAGRYGGAIHIVDSNPSIECKSYESVIYSDYDYDCFFHTPGTKVSQNTTEKKLTFKHNSAGKAGTALFGGTVEKCRLSGFDSGEAFEELASLTAWKGDVTSIVASHPFRVCKCIEYQSDCIQHRSLCIDYFRIHKHPREIFFVPAVAMGQRCGTVPTYVWSYFDVSSNGRFVDFQNIQPVVKTCTNLTYTIFSTNAKEPVKLYADGQCSTAGYHLTIDVVLKYFPAFMDLCCLYRACVCGQRLQKYTNSCNITDRTIAHDGDYWMVYDNQSEELILHEFLEAH